MKQDFISAFTEVLDSILDDEGLNQEGDYADRYLFIH